MKNSCRTFFFLILLSVCTIYSCKDKAADKSSSKTTSEQVDPHTFARPKDAVVKHLDLDIKVDFATKTIAGIATWTLGDHTGKEIIFDTKGLSIERVTNDAGKELKFTIGKEDSVLGKPLAISLEEPTTKLSIAYTTSPSAGALQWLDPQQTSGKEQPFLFTQSQPILGRSWVPCQDGPGIRFTYNAKVTVPKELMAVMSAENPQAKNAEGVYQFKQTHPIPAYLLALAVGDIAFKAIDERTGVYAEPAMLEKSAWEFADMGKMVVAAEKLYGPYAWGRYDVLVLPPSFPYGGMENPNLTFATPTVIAGDRSLVSLIAHELAHSWSGNLVTNATWNDIWLNEGFTTYFERRIVEGVYGKEEAKMQEVLGHQALLDIVEEKGAASEDTKLKGNYAGRDPDEALSDIVYEKGYAFIRTLEENVGRQKLDSFLIGYFSRHAFTSLTTEQFVEELNKELLHDDKALQEKIKLNDWIYGAGIPANAPPVGSPAFAFIDSVIQAGPNAYLSPALKTQVNTSNEMLHFINHLPEDLTVEQMSQLDKTFQFTQSGNSEVQAAWYNIAIRKMYKPAVPYIEKFLVNVGRRKFLRPLYKEMVKTPEGKAWAKTVYAKARANYHPVAYTTVDQIIAK